MPRNASPHLSSIFSTTSTVDVGRRGHKTLRRRRSRKRRRRWSRCSTPSLPAYDFMNHAMTAGLDRLWLRRLVGEAANGNPARILDMATGTGDVALALARRIPEADITGMDLSDGMLSKARAKKGAAGIKFVQADCCASVCPTAASTSSPLPTACAICRHQHRPCRNAPPAASGGKLLVLELSRPTSPIPAAFYNIYTATVIPVAGKACERRQQCLFLSSTKHCRLSGTGADDSLDGCCRFCRQLLQKSYNGRMHPL